MNEFFGDFITHATTIQKGLFLMIVGMVFVFSVQIIFFAIIKIWLKMAGKKESL